MTIPFPSSASPRPLALVTGASGGIGLELARVLGRQGHDLVLVARSEAKLKQLAGELTRAQGTAVTVIAADLACVEGARAAIAQVDVLGRPVDVLVNNAGSGLFGAFAVTPLEKELEMIQLNVTTLTMLTKHVLPGMIARGRGRVLNVASTAAFQPGPLMSVYYATKAYVLSFSEALANELEGSGVTVTALCPGATASGFQAGAGMEASKLVKDRKLPTAASVAEVGIAAMARGKRVVIPGCVNWIMAQGVRLMPRRAVTSLVRKMQETDPPTA